MAKSNFPDRMAAELARAREKHPTKLNSAHEAFAAIREELDELWDAVKADRHKAVAGRTEIVDELVQIAAMCQRAAEDVFASSITWTETVTAIVSFGACDCCCKPEARKPS